MNAFTPSQSASGGSLLSPGSDSILCRGSSVTPLANDAGDPHLCQDLDTPQTDRDERRNSDRLTLTPSMMRYDSDAAGESDPDNTENRPRLLKHLQKVVTWTRVHYEITVNSPTALSLGKKTLTVKSSEGDGAASGSGLSKPGSTDTHEVATIQAVQVTHTHHTHAHLHTRQSQRPTNATCIPTLVTERLLSCVSFSFVLIYCD